MKHLSTSCFLAAAIFSHLSFATPLGSRAATEDSEDSCEAEYVMSSGEDSEPYDHYRFESTSSSESSTTVTSSPPAPVASTSTAPAIATIGTVATSASNGDKVSSTKTGLTPAGTKAGLSGFVGVQNKAGFSQLAEHISWYSDYSPTTPDSGSVQGIPMLWGDASSCSSEVSRLSDFEGLTSTPPIMFGFYEPDCDCPMSSDISNPATGTAAWNTYLAPLAAKGTILGSPSMCKQYDEDWLTPFSVESTTGASLLDASWDVTSIHINKNTLAGVQKDVEYYVSTYGKPIWVSEFACVDDVDGFTACTDQDAINGWLAEVVPYFEDNENVVAYGPSNGEGLGTVWPLFDSTGALSATGTTYLNILKGL